MENKKDFYNQNWIKVNMWFHYEQNTYYHDIDDDYRFESQRQHFHSEGGTGDIDYVDEYGNSGDFYTNAGYPDISEAEKLAREDVQLDKYDRYDLDKLDEFNFAVKSRLRKAGFEVVRNPFYYENYHIPMLQEQDEEYYEQLEAEEEEC